MLRIFITGGAGFIGCNLADHHLTQGHDVTIYDNLSRPRTTLNLEWLQNRAVTRDPSCLHFVHGDVRDDARLSDAMREARPDLVVHLAAQVAVTTSVKNPREDFVINALGTFNVLEAARSMPNPPAVFFASTNKVYGGMEEIAVVEDVTRYRYRDCPEGISENQPLDFHSPYGCSKGAADQYVRDYARIYGLRTVVFRQSCIYGERQFGVEDQGWVAHFVIAAVLNRPITVYGNGKQVRDMLHVSDLISAYDAAWANLDVASGHVLNVGGGARNALSIWSEFGPILETLTKRKIAVTFMDWRPGDQPVYISDSARAKQMIDWKPRINVRDGIEQLHAWVSGNPRLFE